MCNEEDIRKLSDVGLDYMGFIFWEGSSRAATRLDPSALEVLPDTVRRVGVFVDATIPELLCNVQRYSLDIVQLHGCESVGYCSELKRLLGEKVELIKAFPIATSSDLEPVKRYDEYCDYFLFDTKSSLPGGSGRKYDWNILHAYHGPKPFFLSGGIGPDDVGRLNDFKHPDCMAIDINSRFEQKPGVKETERIIRFVQMIKSNDMK